MATMATVIITSMRVKPRVFERCMNPSPDRETVKP
jgi:hypothetical protein